MTKALLARGDSLAQTFVDRLFTLFDDVEVGWDAARAVGDVVNQDKLLTKKNHAVIRVCISHFLSYYAELHLPFSSCLPRISQILLSPA